MLPAEATQGLQEDHFIQSLHRRARVRPSFSTGTAPLGAQRSAAVAAEPGTHCTVHFGSASKTHGSPGPGSKECLLFPCASVPSC